MNKYYYLCEDESIIRVLAKRKPSETTVSRSGTWVVYEYDGKKWEMPCFPEITWKRLSELKYIGKVKIT
jgi:hypothetical protein